MTKKKKIIIIAVVVLLGGGYVAKGFVMPPPKNKDKIKGTLYLMPKEFLVNLADGRYGKVDIALLLAPGQSDGAAGTGAASGNSGTVGTLPEEAVIRDLIVNILTNQNSTALIDTAQRSKLKRKILQAITTQTDVKVSDVLFTDVAVQ